MATIEDLDASPMNLLRAMRGVIIRASLAYPEVLHLDIRDGGDRLWRFSTQDADWSPADPDQLQDRTVEDVSFAPNGELHLQLSGDLRLEIVPASQEAEDDPPNWELITPDGLSLEFGPGVRWQIQSADAP
jgi:hypothetical protein